MLKNNINKPPSITENVIQVNQKEIKYDVDSSTTPRGYPGSAIMKLPTKKICQYNNLASSSKLSSKDEYFQILWQLLVDNITPTSSKTNFNQKIFLKKDKSKITTNSTKTTIKNPNIIITIISTTTTNYNHNLPLKTPATAPLIPIM
ncbi:hypothetical protein ACTFIU_007444 [Dictyostelium citrinum]